MSINKNDIREAIREVLTYLGKHSDSAEELLMLTCAVESQLGTYLKQIKGPARGIFQMEPATERDCWVNFLRNPKNEDLASKIRLLTTTSPLDGLTYNIAYQIAMCRVHYLRVRESLPQSSDINALAQYWKVHYNTIHGKGTVQKAIDAYAKYVL